MTVLTIACGSLLGLLPVSPDGLAGDGEMEAARRCSWKAGGDGDLYDAGNGGDALLELPVDRSGPGRGWWCRVRAVGDAEGEDVVAAGTEVDLGDIPEAAKDEARAGDED